jgi:hypothetical protein
MPKRGDFRPPKGTRSQPCGSGLPRWSQRPKQDFKGEMECGLMAHKFHRGFTAAEKTELWDRWKRGSSVIRVTWAGRERNDATCHNRTHCTSTISCFTRSPCRLSKSACQISQRLTLLPNLARVIGFLFQPIDGFSDSFKLNFSGARYGIG